MKSPWLYPAQPKPVAASPFSGLTSVAAAAFATLAVFATPPSTLVLPATTVKNEVAVQKLPVPVKPTAVSSAVAPIVAKSRVLSAQAMSTEIDAASWAVGGATASTLGAGLFLRKQKEKKDAEAAMALLIKEETMARIEWFFAKEQAKEEAQAKAEKDAFFVKAALEEEAKTKAELEAFFAVAAAEEAAAKAAEAKKAAARKRARAAAKAKAEAAAKAKAEAAAQAEADAIAKAEAEVVLLAAEAEAKAAAKLAKAASFEEGEAELLAAVLKEVDGKGMPLPVEDEVESKTAVKRKARARAKRAVAPAMQEETKGKKRAGPPKMMEKSKAAAKPRKKSKRKPSSKGK